MHLYAELDREHFRSITVRSLECGRDLAVVSMMTGEHSYMQDKLHNNLWTLMCADLVQ